jgi:hypothetical protein
MNTYDRRTAVHPANPWLPAVRQHAELGVHPALQSAQLYASALEIQLAHDPQPTHAADQQLLAHLLDQQLVHIDEVLRTLQQPLLGFQRQDEIKGWCDLRTRLAAIHCRIASALSHN